MKHLAPFIVMIVMLLVIAYVIIAISNYHLKKKILDKGPADNTALEMFKLLNSKLEILKWGIMFFFGGIGLVILEFLPYNENSPLPYGIEAILLSFGFLVYYFLVKNKK